MIHLNNQIRSECATSLNQNWIAKLSDLKNSKIAITGGSGFIGSWLLEMISVLNDDFNFKISVNIFSRNIEVFKRGKEHLLRRPEFEYKSTNVRFPFEMARDTRWIIHGAAIRDRHMHASAPIDTLATISDGTSQTFQASLRCPELRMFLNLSSGLVYGEQPFEIEQIAESFRGAPLLNDLNSLYAQAKRYGETLSTAYRIQERLPIVNVRPFSFIGPYQSLDSPWAVTNFIKDIIQGKDIRVLGDGKSVRSFMYPTDMALWLLVMLVSAQSGESYNLGSSIGIELKDLAAKLIDLVNPQIRILLSVGDVSHKKASRFVPDTSLAKKNFGLTENVNLDEALKRTVQWYQSQRAT